MPPTTTPLLRQTLLSLRTATATATKSNLLYKPLFTQPTAIRAFSATAAKMAAAKDGGVHNLTSKAEFDAALKEPGLMVLDCYATWCGPCKIIAPKVVEFSKEFINARFYKIDVDEVPEVAQELSVRAMPTFILFKDGKTVTDVVGANPVALQSAIKTHYV